MDSVYNLVSKNNSEDLLVIWTAILTFATFLLFIAAVFQEKIKNLFYKPKLNCLILVKSPDCHLLKSHQIYCFRFRIENNGNISAKNVPVSAELRAPSNSAVILLRPNLHKEQRVTQSKQRRIINRIIPLKEQRKIRSEKQIFYLLF